MIQSRIFFLLPRYDATAAADYIYCLSVICCFFAYTRFHTHHYPTWDERFFDGAL